MSNCKIEFDLMSNFKINDSVSSMAIDGTEYSLRIEKDSENSSHIILSMDLPSDKTSDMFTDEMNSGDSDKVNSYYNLLANAKGIINLINPDNLLENNNFIPNKNVINNENIYVGPTMTLNDISMRYNISFSNKIKPIKERIIIVKKGSNVGNNKIDNTVKVKIGNEDFYIVPNTEIYAFAEYIKLNDRISKLTKEQKDNIEILSKEYFKNFISDSQDKFPSFNEIKERSFELDSNKELQEAFISFCKYNLYKNRYDSEIENNVFKIIANASISQYSYASLNKLLNKKLNGEYIYKSFFDNFKNPKNLEDIKKYNDDNSSEYKININKSNITSLLSEASNFLDDCAFRIKRRDNQGYILDFKTSGTIFELIKGLNILKPNNINVNYLESYKGFRIYTIPVSTNKKSRVGYIYSLNGESFTLKGNYVYYDIQKVYDAIDASQVKASAVYPFTHLAVTDELQEILVTSPYNLGVVPGDVKIARRRLLISDDNKNRIEQFSKLSHIEIDEFENKISSVITDKIHTLYQMLSNGSDESNRNQWISSFDENMLYSKLQSWDVYSSFIDRVKYRLVNDGNNEDLNNVNFSMSDIETFIQEAIEAPKDTWVVTSITNVNVYQQCKISRITENNDTVSYENRLEPVSDVYKNNLYLSNMMQYIVDTYKGVKYNEVSPKEAMTILGLQTVNEVDNVNAFVKGGQVYFILKRGRSLLSLIDKSKIVLHEYSHLFLGMMKANPGKWGTIYQLLMSNISPDLIDKASQVSQYKNLSIEDLKEEIFCAGLEAYFKNNGSSFLNLTKDIVNFELDDIKKELTDYNQNTNNNNDQLYALYLKLFFKMNAYSDNSSIENDDNMLSFDLDKYNNARLKMSI